MFRVLQGASFSHIVLVLKPTQKSADKKQFKQYCLHIKLKQNIHLIILLLFEVLACRVALIWNELFIKLTISHATGAY